ncbi:MAG: DUF2325 domain-containing protein [Phormidesmis sp.]
MFKPVLQAVQLFLKGATGKDRQAKAHLSEHLLTLQVAYSQLQQQHDALQQQHEGLQQKHTRLHQKYERSQHSQTDLKQRLHRHKLDLDEFIDVADMDAKDLSLEIEDLQQRLRQSEDEKDALQGKNSLLVGRVAVLENDLTLLSYQSSYQSSHQGSADTNSDPVPVVNNQHPSLESTTNVEAPNHVDLSNISLALIGGHETTYREVTKELQQYGLKRCVHVPPHSVASSDRSQIKDKISNCDLVITITSYVDHSVSRCVKNLQDAQVLAGECIRVSCHGKSGLVREVLQYFQRPLHSS